MINIKSFKTGIYLWTERALRGTMVTADKIVWTKQDAPRPARPYVSLDFLMGPAMEGSFDELREIPGAANEGNFDVTGSRNISITVECYGDDSLEFASILHGSLEKPTVQELLSSYGIALIRQEDVRDVTLAMETRMESRHQFDARFRIVSSSVDRVGFIEKVLVTNLVNNTTQPVGP